jgi:hypothetical protein
VRAALDSAVELVESVVGEVIETHDGGA